MSAADTINGWALFKTISAADLETLARQVGENSLLSRTGGAPSLAVGMAHLFSRALGGEAAMSLWYHFAIMFEALFILTTLDAGTRVGRFMLQDLLGQVYKPLGRVSWYPAVVICSALFVSMWGYFLYQGVTDPLGGINSLWPLFGISNQLLATVALCVGTTVIVKMGKAKYAFVTIIPLVWLVIVTSSAGLLKIFSGDPKLGFLSHARLIEGQIAAGTLPANIKTLEAAQRMIFNDRLDAAVAAFFLVSVVVILTASIIEWVKVMNGSQAPVSSETPYVRTQLVDA
jgi:carbon starvation protein